MKSSNSISLSLLFLIFLALLTGLTNCKDEIDLVLPANETLEETFSIQGRIVKGDPSFVSVRIEGVFRFNNAPKLLAVERITVEDELGNTLSLTSQADGIYFVEIPNEHPFFEVNYGKSYKINVTTLNGINYSSKLEKLFPAPKLETVSVSKEEISRVDPRGFIRFTDQIIFAISTKLKPANFNENVRLSWKLKGTYKVSDTPGAPRMGSCSVPTDDKPKSCYITFSPTQNLALLNASNLTGDSIEQYEILKLPISSIFAEGFYLTVEQQSLSATAYNYLSQVRNVGFRTGDPFESPTGQISTNIINIDNPEQRVFGFFYATEQTTSRVYVSPEIANFPPKTCPNRKSISCIANPVCCNCAFVPNSTAIKPDWWID